MTHLLAASLQSRLHDRRFTLRVSCFEEKIKKDRAPKPLSLKDPINIPEAKKSLGTLRSSSCMSRVWSIKIFEKEYGEQDRGTLKLRNQKICVCIEANLVLFVVIVFLL